MGNHPLEESFAVVDTGFEQGGQAAKRLKLLLQLASVQRHIALKHADDGPRRSGIRPVQGPLNGGRAHGAFPGLRVSRAIASTAAATRNKTASCKAGAEI